MINRNIKINMNEDNIANRRMRANIVGQNWKRNSVPDAQNAPAIVRWPRPTRTQNVKNVASAQSTEPLTNGGPNFRQGSQRQPQSTSLNECRRNENRRICQPNPIKVQNCCRENLEDDYPKSWDISSRLNRQQQFNDNTDRDYFIQELEDRIDAELEVESLFESAPQPRSFSLGKSLPERPGNPIINDKYFVNEDHSQVNSVNDKLPFSSSKQISYFRAGESNIERQRRIMQEDYEAENEIHQLLFSPEVKLQNQSSSLRCLSCSSELSSFESEISRLFVDEVSQED